MEKSRRVEYPCTDAGNAELFAALYGDQVRFDHKRRRWLIWQGHWWARDVDGEVRRLAKQATRTRYIGALDIADDKKRMEMLSWAMTSESRARLDAALALAQSERPLADDGTNWDSDPWLLGVPNGVVDLRTGTLRQGHPADRSTLHTDVAFEPSAQCPRWLQFLDEVFGGDPELICFIERAVGYSLTGETREQCLLLCYGGGANGKTTFLEVLRHVFGEYAHNLPFSAFELKGRAPIPNDIASLAGRRLVTAIETSEATRLNEARVKALTGNDAITARFLYGEFFTFHPVAKFWLAFNHRPLVADDSLGFWRRIRLIPFLQEFRGAADDKQLLSKLKADATGILAWAVQGCLAWQRDGLGMPNAVKEATDAYREESDPLSEFICDRCVVNRDAHVTAARLWDEYQNWAGANGERSLDRKAFTRRLQARGFEKGRRGHERTWVWRGLCCRYEAQEQGIPLGADTRTDADGKSHLSPNMRLI